jgi:hypothetical protein
MYDIWRGTLAPLRRRGARGEAFFMDQITTSFSNDPPAIRYFIATLTPKVRIFAPKN